MNNRALLNNLLQDRLRCNPLISYGNVRGRRARIYIGRRRSWVGEPAGTVRDARESAAARALETIGPLGEEELRDYLDFEAFIAIGKYLTRSATGG